MPREKAYSSFNISGEGSTLPKSILKEYSQRVCRQRYEAAFSIFAFDLKKNYFKYWVVKKGSFAKPKINIKTKIMGN